MDAGAEIGKVQDDAGGDGLWTSEIEVS